MKGREADFLVQSDDDDDDVALKNKNNRSPPYSLSLPALPPAPPPSLLLSPSLIRIPVSVCVQTNHYTRRLRPPSLRRPTRDVVVGWVGN